MNFGLKRLSYDGRLTVHGISATYNHAEYVEQRRLMMQDWADRLDLFEQGQVQVASTHLTIHLQGLPTIAGQQTAPLPTPGQHAPIMLVTSPEHSLPPLAPSIQRLSAVEMPDYARSKPSEAQLARMRILGVFEQSDNVVVAEYARLVGKSRR